MSSQKRKVEDKNEKLAILRQKRKQKQRNLDSRNRIGIHTFPPFRPFALIVSGGQPVSSTHVTSAPSCCNPSIRSAIGHSLIRGTPSNTNFPFPMHNAAANGLIAVPAFPKSNSHVLSSSSLLNGELMGLF